METLLWTALFLPLAGFLFLLFFAKHIPRLLVCFIGPGTVLASFIAFFTLFYQDISPLTTTLYTWLPLKEMPATFTLYLDHLSLLMTLIVTGVGFLIHAYAVGYMDHEKDIGRFFCEMNFFIFSMLLLVLSANLLLFFVGWEGVGLASYLLIGFWYERPAAQKAAKKAFVVNRIGDLGLLLGIFLTYALFGTSDIQEVVSRAPKELAFGAPIAALLALLYFWGSCGKSAQIPLHTWLPDAMEGPTPVSALIHAATMVTAGVYLVVRMHPVFEIAPWTLTVVGTVGIITSLFAALVATSQTDLKRVLAYSTLSQLGLMFCACGAGAYFAAMFHLTTHAFVKALLFLSAGSVIHMMHGTTQMAEMGGLARYLKITNILFLIGALALAAIPPLAIFFSKDLILEEITKNGAWYLAGICVTILTAYYIMRAYLLTFTGKCHAEHVHEAPCVMYIPVIILALLSIVGGLFDPVLKPFLELSGAGFHFEKDTWISIILAIVGIIIALFRLRISFRFLYQAFYINELYDLCIVRPARALSRTITRFFEPAVFDSSVEMTADTTLSTAKLLQKVQSGLIRAYISWIVLGASLLILYVIYVGVS